MGLGLWQNLPLIFVGHQTTEVFFIYSDLVTVILQIADKYKCTRPTRSITAPTTQFP